MTVAMLAVFSSAWLALVPSRAFEKRATVGMHLSWLPKMADPRATVGMLSWRPKMVDPRAAVGMDLSWRPKTVDPLGQAMGMPAARERDFELWLDLRTSEVTFAQMVVVRLFYEVRRVVDEAGRALPRGARVEGLLFDEDRFERADTIGVDMPAYVASSGGAVFNATTAELVPMSAELRSPVELDALADAQQELQGLAAAETTRAIVLPADPMLWAVSLTGLPSAELQCKEGNEGA